MKQKLLYYTRVSVLCLLSTGTFADASVPRYLAELEGAQEVTTIEIPGASAPLNNGPVASGGYGVAELAISLDRSSLEYSVEIINLGTEVQKVHVHLGPRGANGPMLFSIFNIADGGAFGLSQAGFLTIEDLQANPDLGINTMEDVFTNLKRNNLYFNIHTLAIPSGELRGQVGETGQTGQVGALQSIRTLESNDSDDSD